MFKKSISVFLVVMLVAGLFSSFSAGAAEANNTTDTSQLKTLTLEVENNTSTYYDENGKEFDTSGLYAARRCKTALPSSYDLRDYGRSTSVKNQGLYGFCWSFASTASMESSILTKGIGNETSSTLDLSETGNSWYLRTNTEDTSSSIYGDYLYDSSYGANGGTAEYVADSLSSGFGAYPEELVSYGDFANGYSDALRFYSDYRLKDFTSLTYDVDLIKQQIMNNGAVYYSYNSFDENYYTSNGMETYYDNGTSISGEEPYQGHAVTIIGWDDNFSKDNFNPAFDIENDGAWLCKNSWGTNYQQNVADDYKGYFWVSYESNANDVAQFVMQDADSFDNVYQHQATGDVYLYADSESGFFSAANVYTAQSNEKLEQICFSNIGATKVTTKIYKLGENYTSPVDGELLTEFTTNITSTGTHCIDCPKELVFNQGDIFSVVIEGDNLIAKFKEAGYEETDCAGKSYFCLDDEWIDSADELQASYAAIKAYTCDLSVDKSELSALVETAKALKPENTAEETAVSELNTTITEAQKVLADKNATSNEVNNAYCILKSKVDALDNYSFYINNMDDFLKFCSGEVNSKYIELNTDLDLADTDISNYYEPVNLNGVTFNGNGHTIKNFTLTRETQTGMAGFFGKVNNSVVKDITFENAYVEGACSAATICSSASNSQLINCNVKNSTVKSIDGMQAALIACDSANCTYTDCTVENSTAVGGYVTALYAYDSNNSNTFDNCKASDYTLMSYSSVSDNQGFVFEYNTNNYDALAALTVTDNSCTVQELIGEIESVKYNNAEITPVDGVYHIEKTNGTVCPDITFNDYEYSGFAYSVDISDRTITVSGYLKDSSDIVIPDVMYGLPVTTLSDKFTCYQIDENDVKSISIPGSVKTIPQALFADFENLESVTFGEGVEVIENSAFEGCVNLSQIKLPDSLRTIGEMAFFGCSATDVTLGKNIESIANYALGYQMGENGLTPVEGFTIHGYAGTAAEDYANANGFTFVDLTN